MSLWDNLPAGTAPDSLRELLDGLNGSGPTEVTDADGTWKTYTATENLHHPLSLDPGTGSFTRSAGTTGTPLEFPDPTATVELGLHLTGPGGSTDGGWRVVVGTPIAIVRLPFLRGAMLDGTGQLRADPAHPDVRFTLPALRLRVQQLSGQAVGVKLLSAAVGGNPVENIYDFVRMDPPYALIGPSDVVGFAFRTAVLDLSGTAGPSGVPATARAMPGDWQGLYLPEARLFVAPNGLDGLAVSAGVRDLWIGFGVHAGVTGIFEAEVVNRGSSPTLAVHFRTSTGGWVGDPGAGTAMLPQHSTLFVDAAGGIAPLTVTIAVDGVTTTADRVDVTTPANGQLSITVTVTDGGSHTTTRTFSAARSTAGGPGPSGGDAATLTPGTSGNHRIVLDSQTPTTATLRLEPPATADWTWDGGGQALASPTAEIPVAAAANVAVTARLAAPEVQFLDVYFFFDHPKPGEAASPSTTEPAYGRNPANTFASPAAGRDTPSSGGSAFDAAQARVGAIGAGTHIVVDGYASWEGSQDPAQTERNQHLSRYRLDAAVALLTDAGFTDVVPGVAHGETNARNGTKVDAADPDPVPVPGASSWWLARGRTPVPAGPETCTAHVARPAPNPPAATDPKPPDRGRPDCFRKLGARVELIRSTFIRAELYGEFDIETAAESQLAAHGDPPLRNGARPNPMDGVCTFLVRFRIAEDRNSWDITGEFRAAEGDLDGLAKMEEGQANQTALNILGAMTVLAPIASATATLSPAAGDIVELGTIALGAFDLITTKSLILRGGELIVSQGIIGPDGATTQDSRGTAVSFLLDLEVAFTFDLTIVRVDPAHPITTRYKAVGLRSQWGNSGTTQVPDYVPIPVFDPSRGYTLDIPAGALAASPPLDNILRMLGAKVSRSNPTYLEVEVGLGVELGIVKVDSVRVRARLDGPLEITLTKLGATLDIPGVIHGSGYIEITDDGFKGAFDLTIVPVNVRGTAVLAVESRNGTTGVLVGLEVEFPVAFPLGNSGLGLLGLMGGVGVNYARNEDLTKQVPALDWLMKQFTPPRLGVMDPDGWDLTPGAYAFAAGALIGTLEGGYVVHLKGIIIIEVPGPRLLLVMKADVLSAPPVLGSQQSATFLAVLDIDFGRGTITVGVVAQYEIAKILKIRVPVTAFFDTHQPEKWLVELGKYDDQVTVNVLDVISGTGYLMVHGDGVNIPPLPEISHGLAVAVGFHIECVLMGSKAVGLYLEVGAGFDAVLGFDPFFLGGKIYVNGELRLFIVSIGASAELTVLVGKRLVGGVEQDAPYVHGEVCGHVDFFFFSVKGCVSLTIGDEPDKTPTPADLVTGVMMMNRNPARLEGSAISGKLDGKLGDALSVEHPPTGATTPVVPLDAFPVIGFATSPDTAAAAYTGVDAPPNVAAGANPWTRIGDRWWKYHLQTVELDGALTPANGATPSMWWKQSAPGISPQGAALALLDWLPTPFSVAIPYGTALTEQVDHRWGTVCDPVAPAAAVLWTFDHRPVGPSTTGWHLDGVVWPDPPGTLRTAAVQSRADVTEPWRCDPFIDVVQGTDPAVVIGDAVPCYTDKGTIREAPLKGWAAGQPLSFSRAVLPDDAAAFEQVTAILAGGAALGDVPAIRASTAWDRSLAGVLRGQTKLGCDGRILRSPTQDRPEPAPRGTPEDQDLVKRAWSRTGFTPDELADAVRIHVPGAPESIELMLLVPGRLVEKQLVVQYRDEAGTTVGETRVTGADLVSGANPVPGAWNDPGGPWADPVQRAGRIAARVAATDRTALSLALVNRADLPKETVDLVVGWDRNAFQEQDPPAFYVIALSAALASERRRASYDETVRTGEQTALSSGLSEPPDNRALLVPGTTYTVKVTWSAESREQDAQPAAGDGGVASPPVTQSYRFVAAGADESPKDLTPWLLATTPGSNDLGVFCTEPVRIDLATQKVVDLFKAYDKELRVVVQAASGSHPTPPGGGGPGSPVVVPQGIGGIVTQTAGLVLSPWHQAAGELVDASLPCVSTDGEATATSTWTIPYTFEPLTDYLIDIHSVPTGAPQNAVGLIHRIGFTTSRFADVDDLAAFIGPAPVQHRVLTSATPLQDATSLPTTPSGDQLDAAFQAAGLAAPQVPGYPEVYVLWSPDAVPQPVAVVVESSEPLWRSRSVPTQHTAPSDSPDPAHTWWTSEPADWLSLADSTTAPAGGDLPRTAAQRIVRGPGGTRAVVLLAAGARGHELRLDLVVSADVLAGTPEKRATAVRVSLIGAPWEVED